MDERTNKNDMVDTTDCLEAISAFKGMKNFLFTITVICLLLLQIIFWIEWFGCIGGTKAAPTAAQPAISVEAAAKTANQTTPAAETIDEQARRAAKGITEEPAKPDEIADTNQTINVAGTHDKTETSKTPRLKSAHIASVIKICNFIVIVTATLYCLVLLMSVKISLVGRLGGINHISRAFFLSLFALVVLLPWQRLLPGVIVGAVYTPDELFCGAAKDGASIIFRILYYLRFVGMWLIEILLLLFAQFRSGRWAKATLRRLGIVQ